MKALHAPTSADVRAIVVAARDDEAKDRALADKVRDIVATFDGKQIGKRLKDKLGEAFTEGPTPGGLEGRALVHLQKESYGAWTLFIWSGNTGRTYDNRLMFFIPSEHKLMENNETLGKGFERSNPSFYIGTDERQALRRKALDETGENDLSVFTKFANAVARYHMARAEMKALASVSGAPLGPDEYKLTKAFDLGSLY